MEEGELGQKQESKLLLTIIVQRGGVHNKTHSTTAVYVCVCGLYHVMGHDEEVFLVLVQNEV